VVEVHSDGPVQALEVGAPVVVALGAAVADVHDVQVLWASEKVKVKDQLGLATAAAAKSAGIAMKDFIFVDM
jgi:hypothetical protein